VFGHIGGSQLPLDSIGLPASAVIGAFTVGIVVTVVAALLPAVRASRIPPVAALQDVATPDRPLTRVTVAGGLVTAVGATLLGLGLSGRAHDNTLWAILGGVLVSFIGVALLTPLVARPVVSVLGRLFSWSVPGKLGRLNSGRNPRRTAITAAALMVGLALITGVNVILASTTKSLEKTGDTQVKADLIISGEQRGPLPPTFDPAVLDRARQLGGVTAVAGETVDEATINGRQAGVTAVSDLPALVSMFPIKASEGSLGPLRTDQVLVDADRATKLGLHAGSTITVQLSRGAPHTMTVVGVYAKNDVYAGWILAPDAVREFHVAQPSFGYLR